MPLREGKSRSGCGNSWQLVLVLQAFCLLALVLAEPFYQRRDHLDQSRYLQEHNDNVVKDRTDAEFVLSKYGYLRCQVRRKRREAATRTGRGGVPSLLDVVGGGGARTGTGESPAGPQPWDENFSPSEEVCDEEAVAQAIREYQRTYNLPPTGELDDETKQLMSTSRCGNKDSADEGEAGSTSAAAPTTTLASAGAALVISSPSSSSQRNGSDSVNIGDSATSPRRHHHHHHHHGKKDDGHGKKEDGLGNKSDQLAHSQRLRKRAVNRVRADDPSQLLRVLKNDADNQRKSASELRHRRHLQEYLQRLNQKDLSPLLQPWTPEEHRRARRSIIQVTAHGGGGGGGGEAGTGTGTGAAGADPMMMDVVEELESGAEAQQQLTDELSNNEMFKKEIVSWRLLSTGYSTRIPVEDQRATIDLAFRMWSEVIPLRFIEDTDSDISQVDIEVAFGRGSHQNCEHDFDGNGGEIAHSRQAGDMHFDDEENFKSIHTYTPDGIYFLRVAVHEIGHVLGLAHTNKSQSIMYAIYHGRDLSPEFELSRDDRKDIQKIYGVCKGKFSTVFDWVRRRPDSQFIYNTYFFRENHYWMYENHANRTRYGDPLYIAREWDGVPDKCDGYLHIWFLSPTSGLVDEAYFFKGEYYFKYDSENDRVFDGWPRRIREDFGPKAGQTEGVPDNVDSVFFDMRDKNVYFFKDEWVYVYDPKEPRESRGCCVRKRLITEEFPLGVEGQPPLPGRLDAVYYSYGDKMQYFIKDEDLWRNRVFDIRQKRPYNSVEYMGKWYDRWMDICDVQAH